MRIAILYATKSGTTRECAVLLQKQLPNHTVELYDLAAKTPTLSDYDLLVLGSSVRMGKLQKEMRRYLKENLNALLKIDLGLFLCCGFADCFEDYLHRCIPADLREHSIAVSCFGGSLDPKRVKGFDRLIVKWVRNEILGGGDNADQRSDMTLPTVMEGNISQFAEKIKALAEKRD